MEQVKENLWFFDKFVGSAGKSVLLHFDKGQKLRFVSGRIGESFIGQYRMTGEPGFEDSFGSVFC
jgi:hypothetical protein